MSGSRDPWRLPSLDRLGSQLRRLEEEDEGRRAGLRGGRGRLLGLAGVILAAALTILIVVDAGQRAAALSVINRAPGLAARSTSVSFSAAISIAVDGREIRRLSQLGEIDFASGAYRTALELGGASGVLERRRAAGVLYISETSRGGRVSPASRWVATNLTAAQRVALTPAPGADAFTDPLALLGVLAKTHSPVRILGRDSIDGVPTTRYRLVSDLATVLGESADGAREPRAYRAVRATLTVWLDRQGRPRRVAELFSGTSLLGPATLETVTTFFGYGQPVSIQAPSGVRPSAARPGGGSGSLAGNPSRLFERLLFGRR